MQDIVDQKEIRWGEKRKDKYMIKEMKAWILIVV